jgi:hypothetical protein
MCLDKSMKKSCFVILTVILYACAPIAYANDEDSIKKGKELIALVEKQQDGSIERGLESYRILGVLAYTPSFPELVTFSTNKWELILQNWDQLVTNRTQRLIEMHAMSFLPAEKYIKWLDQLLVLYREKQLSDTELFALLVMIENDKQGFLAYNYKAPEVVDFLNRLDKEVKGIGHAEKTIENIRSGKRKWREEFLRNQKTKLFRDNNRIPMLPSMIKYEKSLFGQIEKRKTSLFIGLMVLSIIGVIVYRKKRLKA